MRRAPTNPKLLTLLLALPCNAFALGLGAIHVESTLGEPLKAYIEIPGASNDELARIKASIADEALFKRHGLDRTSFLSSLTITAAQDKLKGPILWIRSNDLSVEPLLSFLVDVHSSDGEFVREYSILLDPPGVSTERHDATAQARSAPSPAAIPTTSPVSSVATAVSRSISTATGHTSRAHTVARHDTLAHIVAQTGAHSRVEQRRMMVAIYRNNPNAFAGNMNSLRAGVVLQLPDAGELAAVSAEDASHEYSTQMKAWKAVKPQTPHPQPALAAAAPVAAPNSQPSTSAESDAETIALQERIQTLEESLARVREELNRPMPVLDPQPAPVTEAETPQAADTDTTPDVPAAPARTFGMRQIAIAGGCALILVVGVWLFGKRRRAARKLPPTPLHDDESDTLIVKDLTAMASQRAANPQRAALTMEATVLTAGMDATADPDAAEAKLSDDTIAFLTGGRRASDAARKPENSAATTLVLAVPENKYDETLELTLTAFNPEATVNTTHVTIPDSLNQDKPFVERRKNPADVLRQALEREPNRSDLRLKLLELYYIAAEQNRRAFLEIAHQLAKNIHMTSPQEWAQILDMGRKIASDDPLFAPEQDDDQAVA